MRTYSRRYAISSAMDGCHLNGQNRKIWLGQQARQFEDSRSGLGRELDLFQGDMSSWAEKIAKSLSY